MGNKPLCRKANIVIQEFENEILIYDLNINTAFCLNQTSALVYQLCDGTKTVAEISDLMSKMLKTLVSEDIVWLAINELKKNNLLENETDLTNHFAGLTRREAVKRVGLTTMVALPIISSIIAPSAIMAQTGGLAPGSACTTSPECQEQNCSRNTCCVATNTVSPTNLANDVFFATGNCPVDVVIYCCSGMGSPFGGGGDCQCS